MVVIALAVTAAVWFLCVRRGGGGEALTEGEVPVPVQPPFAPSCHRKEFCVGLNKSGKLACYGSSRGCKWKSWDCKTDADCSAKYAIDSAHYTDGHTCDSIMAKKPYPKSYWGITGYCDKRETCAGILEKHLRSSPAHTLERVGLLATGVDPADISKGLDAILKKGLVVPVADDNREVFAKLSKRVVKAIDGMSPEDADALNTRRLFYAAVLHDRAGQDGIGKAAKRLEATGLPGDVEAILRSSSIHPSRLSERRSLVYKMEDSLKPIITNALRDMRVTCANRVHKSWGQVRGPLEAVIPKWTMDLSCLRTTSNRTSLIRLITKAVMWASLRTSTDFPFRINPVHIRRAKGQIERTLRLELNREITAHLSPMDPRFGLTQEQKDILRQDMKDIRRKVDYLQIQDKFDPHVRVIRRFESSLRHTIVQIFLRLYDTQQVIVREVSS